MDAVSIYAELAREARLTELEDANDDLHGEIRELDGIIDALSSDVVDAEREINRRDEKIRDAIDSLRVLGEVPLKDLESSIEDIIAVLN